MVLTGLQDQEATQSLLTCLSIGYGQFAHAILSLWFILLTIPSWVLPALLPPFLGGGAIAVIAATTSVLCWDRLRLWLPLILQRATWTLVVRLL